MVCVYAAVCMGVLVVMKQSAVETKLCIQPRPVTEVGESVEECCVREVMEESGVLVDRHSLQFVASQVGVKMLAINQLLQLY